MEMVDYSPINRAIEFQQQRQIKLQELEMQKQAEARRQEYNQLLMAEMQENIKSRQSAEAAAKAIGDIPTHEPVTSTELKTFDTFNADGDMETVTQPITSTKMVPRSPDAVIVDAMKAAGKAGNAAATLNILQDYVKIKKNETELQKAAESNRIRFMRTLAPSLNRGSIEEGTRNALLYSTDDPKLLETLNRLPTHRPTDKPNIYTLESNTEFDDQGRAKVIGYQVRMPNGQYKSMGPNVDMATLQKIANQRFKESEARTNLIGEQTRFTRKKTERLGQQIEAGVGSTKKDEEGVEITRLKGLYSTKMSIADREIKQIQSSNPLIFMKGRAGLNERIEAAQKAGNETMVKSLKDLATKYDAAVVERDTYKIKMDRLIERSEKRLGKSGRNKVYSQEDLQYTADKHGISIDEVKRRLGVE